MSFRSILSCSLLLGGLARLSYSSDTASPEVPRILHPHNLQTFTQNEPVLIQTLLMRASSPDLRNASVCVYINHGRWLQCAPAEVNNAFSAIFSSPGSYLVSVELVASTITRRIERTSSIIIEIKGNSVAQPVQQSAVQLTIGSDLDSNQLKAVNNSDNVYHPHDGSSMRCKDGLHTGYCELQNVLLMDGIIVFADPTLSKSTLHYNTSRSSADSIGFHSNLTFPGFRHRCCAEGIHYPHLRVVEESVEQLQTQCTAEYSDPVYAFASVNFPQHGALTTNHMHTRTHVHTIARAHTHRTFMCGVPNHN